MTADKIWDKAEKYMIDLVQPPSLINRLTVVVFKGQFAEDRKYLDAQISAMKLLFTFIESNTTMYKVLGMALAIGNIMNGNTPKGRSDGFELGVLSKLNTTKDNNQRPMLQFIMKKLVEADPELSTNYR